MQTGKDVLRTAETPSGGCAIGDYAVIGDCRSAALVSRFGSIDWLCWPCFDSPAVFGKLLDTDAGGFWRICPAEPFRAQRRYLGTTNVVETLFETDNGVIRLVDFMPIGSEGRKNTGFLPEQQILRLLDCLSGEVTVKVIFNPRPHYGQSKARLKDRGRLGLRLEAGRGLLALHGGLKYELTPGGAYCSKAMHAGETLSFALTYAAEAPSVLPDLAATRELLQETTEWWEKWASQCTYEGAYRDAVIRSALTLKLLQFGPSGAFIGAPTTSLPEKIGHDLNWDYRFCWLRDASLTIQALHGTGFKNEATSFANWTLHATRLTQPKLMVMYDVYGNPVKDESVLSQWAGYQASRPVRVGNRAKKQIQLDTYGEVICGVAQILKSGGEVDRETAKALVGFGKYVCRNWQAPDDGIWEPEGEPTAHTHSRLLCWVALEQLLQLAEAKILHNVPIPAFESVRAQIRQDLESNAWNEVFASYSSEPGSQKLDATLLLLALHKFEDVSTDRLSKTYERIRNHLGAGGALLYRNRTDGVATEGAFGICSFWGVEFLAMGGGTLVEAHKGFQDLLSYANDVGLFAEEIDPQTGGALGNFPQAFTHVGLINAAMAIAKRESLAGISHNSVQGEARK